MSDKCRYCHEFAEQARLAEQRLEQLRADATSGKYGSYNQVCAQNAALTASLAELRKRIEALTGYWENIEERSEEAHAVYQKEAHRRGDVRHDDDYAKLSEPTKEWDRVLVRWVNDRVRLFLASPPSPAPVEKMPMVVKVNPKACVKCGCGPSAHWADNDGPLKGAYCDSCCQCADYVPPAPVESKPCAHHARLYPCGKEGCDECVVVPLPKEGA